MASLVTTTVTGKLTVNGPSETVQIKESDTRGAIRLGGANAGSTSRIYLQANGDNSYIDSYGNSAYKALKIDASTLKLNDDSNGTITTGTGAFNVNGALTGTAATFTGKVSAFLNTTSSPLHTRGSNIIFDAANGGTNVNILARAYDETYWGQMEFTATQGWITTRTTGSLILGANNAGVIYIVNGGKVGIGTTNPGFNLDVQGSGTPTLCVRNTSASADAMIHVGEPNTTAYGLQIKWVGATGRVYFDNRYNHATNPYMFFRMRTSSGSNTVTAITINPAGSVNLKELQINGAFTFPTADGTANQMLKTDGGGTLTWTSAGTGTVTGTGTNNYIASMEWNNCFRRFANIYKHAYGTIINSYDYLTSYATNRYVFEVAGNPGTGLPLMVV